MKKKYIIKNIFNLHTFTNKIDPNLSSSKSKSKSIRIKIISSDFFHEYTLILFLVMGLTLNSHWRPDEKSVFENPHRPVTRLYWRRLSDKGHAYSFPWTDITEGFEVYNGSNSGRSLRSKRLTDDRRLKLAVNSI